MCLKNECEQKIQTEFLIKFCVKRRETPTVMFEKFKKVYGDSSL